MKKTPPVIERLSVGWINSIPRKLARGIWDAIEDAIDGKEHTNARSNERRKIQIGNGTLGTGSRGTTQIAQGAADRAAGRTGARVSERERNRGERRDTAAAIREAVVAATEAGNSRQDNSEEHGDDGDADGYNNTSGPGDGDMDGNRFQHSPDDGAGVSGEGIRDSGDSEAGCDTEKKPVHGTREQ